MMKKLSKLWIAIFISILFAIPSLLAVLFYTKPMKDASYDLSIFSGDGQEWGGDKGWTFYKDVEGTKTDLTSDGGGGYTGLDYAGQTFYFSRELTEKLDSPTLQIGVANRNISVFLDDTLIYTDCPDLDNRIGYLELPMLEYDRTEPVSISLPSDYQGQTLTVAQSTANYSETQEGTDTVWPCAVTLYCGYSYESGLIASTSNTMIPAVLLFAFIILLLGAFLWNASLGTFLPVLPVLTLTVLFFMCSILTKADFFGRYFDTISPDPVWLFFNLSVGTLPVFLGLYTKELKPRVFFLCIAGIQYFSIIFSSLVSLGLLFPYGDIFVFFRDFPQVTGFLILLATLVSSFFIRRNGQQFWKHFTKAVLLIIGAYLVFLLGSVLIQPEYTTRVFTRLAGDCKILLPNFSLKLVWYLCLFSTSISFLLDLLEKESERRTEVAILSERSELAVKSYENLQQQTDEIMMLRHDMNKHYTMLREMAENTPEKIIGYLDDLIGDMQNQRPVVTTQNQVLDILLNGEINTATAKGIPVTILRSDAPCNIPLKDTELCSLIMNILDNAIQAASKPDVLNPYIELDFHCKEHHFVFTCKNSYAPKHVSAKREKNTVPKHGYGLKIIHHIMENFGSMYSIKEEENSYQITIILPF